MIMVKIQQTAVSLLFTWQFHLKRSTEVQNRQVTNTSHIWYWSVQEDERKFHMMVPDNKKEKWRPSLMEASLKLRNAAEVSFVSKESLLQ